MPILAALLSLVILGGLTGTALGLSCVALTPQEMLTSLLFLNHRPDGSRRTSLCSGTRATPGVIPSEVASVLGEGYSPSVADDPLPIPARAARVPTWAWSGGALVLGAGTLLWWRRRRSG